METWETTSAPSDWKVAEAIWQDEAAEATDNTGNDWAPISKPIQVSSGSWHHADDGSTDTPADTTDTSGDSSGGGIDVATALKTGSALLNDVTPFLQKLQKKKPGGSTLPKDTTQHKTTGKTPQTTGKTPPPPKKNNTLLYVGIGLGVVVIGGLTTFLILRSHKTAK